MSTGLGYSELKSSEIGGVGTNGCLKNDLQSFIPVLKSDASTMRKTFESKRSTEVYQ